MPDEHETVGEARIREAIQSFAAAFRAKDIGGVMSLFAPTIISFDLAPPLRCVGAEALRKHWEATFAALQGPVAYEIHDLAIEASDRLSFSHSLNWMRGTLQDGRTTERWLRWTVCFRLIDGRWQATHEHVSVPIEVASGKALFDLAP
ncbi:YybH family protein [Frateuria sp. YIM B11624]|uniref:YybH family protein n=1 Tax=Frateuria sp. YIM B11624 TaxID=3143185 RepID=UPI003C76E4E4